jgi:hypothetical protein
MQHIDNHRVCSSELTYIRVRFDSFRCKLQCNSLLDGWTEHLVVPFANKPTNAQGSTFLTLSLLMSYIYIYIIYIYSVSQEEWIKLRESVPYVKLYRYNPKHLYPKLNFTEIMAIEKYGLLVAPRTIDRPWRHTRPLRMAGNETSLANTSKGRYRRFLSDA